MTKTRQTFGELLIQAAGEALAYQRGELQDVRVTRAKVTARRVAVAEPREYAADDIREVRQGLGVSQAVFAQLLGASSSTVRAWEQGTRMPSLMARRLLSVVERSPELLEQDLLSTDDRLARVR